MAGHSHWAGIKHKKGRQDKIRSKIFSKISREITVAAKLGSKDPETNHRLRAAIESAKEKYKHKENIEFVHHSSPYIWLDDDMIDAVYSIDVVEHLHPEDFKIHLEEIYRVLTKGGVYVFLTCDGDNGPSDCSSWFYPKGFGFQPKGIHLKEYTFVELINCIADSGYKIAEIPKLDFPFGIVVKK